MSRFCGQCGSPVPLEVRFCPECGASMSANAPQAAAAPGPAQPAASFAPPAPATPLMRAPAPVPPQPQTETMWHFAFGGITQGPMPESALRALMPSLPADTKVWNPSLPSWLSAEQAGLRAAPPRAYAAAPVQAPSAFSAPGSPYAPPAYMPVSNGPAAAYPGYGAPAGYPAQPAYPPYGGQVAAPVSPGYGPMPPDMHWALVMILSGITLGIMGIIWAFRQASFVKKIDPASKAVTLLVLSLLGAMVQVVLVFVAIGASLNTMAEISFVEMILYLVLLVMGLVTIFSMRKSLVTYYNTAEPIGLRLSGIMTFFFSMLYFQYHFSRIANWKKTGRLQ